MVSMRAMVVMVHPTRTPLSSRPSNARAGTQATVPRRGDIAWVPGHTALRLARDDRWGSASSFLLRRPLQPAVEFLRGEVAALIVVADRVGGKLRLPFQRSRDHGFGIAARLVAVAVGGAVVPPAARVAGGAVEDLVADVGMLEPDADQLQQVVRLQPDRGQAQVGRLVADIADAQAQHLEPELVGIERAERFTERLADTVARVRQRGDINADALVARIEPD